MTVQATGTRTAFVKNPRHTLKHLEPALKTAVEQLLVRHRVIVGASVRSGQLGQLPYLSQLCGRLLTPQNSASPAQFVSAVHAEVMRQIGAANQRGPAVLSSTELGKIQDPEVLHFVSQMSVLVRELKAVSSRYNYVPAQVDDQFSAAVAHAAGISLPDL